MAGGLNNDEDDNDDLNEFDFSKDKVLDPERR